MSPTGDNLAPSAPTARTVLSAITSDLSASISATAASRLMMKSGSDRMTDFAERKLYQVRSKLDANYGPLTGRQWIAVAATLEAGNMEAEAIGLVNRFAVPIADLIDAAGTEGFMMRRQQT